MDKYEMRRDRKMQEHGAFIHAQGNQRTCWNEVVFFIRMSQSKGRVRDIVKGEDTGKMDRVYTRAVPQQPRRETCNSEEHGRTQDIKIRSTSSGGKGEKEQSSWTR